MNTHDVCDVLYPGWRNVSPTVGSIMPYDTQKRIDDLCDVGLVEGVERRTGRFRVTTLLGKLQNTLDLSLSSLLQMEARHGDAVEELYALVAVMEKELPESSYRTDLIASVREMGTCLGQGCYIAVLGLGGKILEICIKQRMDHLHVPFDDSWMLGTLLGELKDVPSQYIDPAIGNVANIIKESRIPAVHSKREVPVPSPAQAVMVVNATVDVVRRMLLAPAPPPIPNMKFLGLFRRRDR